MSESAASSSRHPGASRPSRPSRARRGRRARVAASFAVLLAVAGYVAMRYESGGGGTPRCVVGSGGHTYTLSPEQASNAATISAVGTTRGMPERAVTIALATALQESALRNIDYGDRDSLGLFQQRPSQGWGTPEQIMDPVYSAGIFYDRLAEVPGYSRLPLTVAAQRVQRSGFPQAYAKHEPDAALLAAALTGRSAASLTCAPIRGAAPGDPERLRGELVRAFGAGVLSGAPAGPGDGKGGGAPGEPDAGGTASGGGTDSGGAAAGGTDGGGTAAGGTGPGPGSGSDPDAGDAGTGTGGTAGGGGTASARPGGGAAGDGASGAEGRTVRLPVPAGADSSGPEGGAAEAGSRRGWELAQWAVARADELDVVEVAYAGRVWSVREAREGWRPAGSDAGTGEVVIRVAG
ncbi:MULTISPECIES: hypothetical protein [Streptomyces]|uniref:ARB-07466-like C-terminal domain-containing protein n=2 Tax=Streptomyces fradiae TaxID=1906 RepID=A0A1Y2NVC2_STRFR|nr:MULTISPECIES: hypothetical protein [Streptomyces]KAF0651488.1 hypothetical protein K701_03005 [Streptomyces fradiae ATCC 10745 = DSM 40063]OSY51446.1 hypothetical protein BG846_02889 [Streptomyces fradiae ATCC 10745 = DSM 40063]